MADHKTSVQESLHTQMEAHGRVIANFAWQHMKAADTFRAQVESLEQANLTNAFGPFFEDVRSYGSGCIMSAAASLEALINEFFITPVGPLRKELADFENLFWGRGGIEWKPPLEKYQVALKMLGHDRLDESASVFRNTWALLELRNALVHYKPTWDPDRQRRVDMIEVLAGKYELSPFPDNGSNFVTMRSMSGVCMRWVISTPLTFMHEFHDRAKIDPHKMSAFWRIHA